MIEQIVLLLSGCALALGCFFMLSGAVGLLRFPDFYTRMHAAGVTDTLATFLILGGLMLLAGWSLALFKLGLILLFLFFTGPVASHALARAAQHSEWKLSGSGSRGGKRGPAEPVSAPAEVAEADALNTDRV
ncbi:monovalent cation/H(+) antiporter subunit G [Microbulbifer marinus]|uniref:Multisubunit sodium/proton antiporter, MrpG subunit n=1 Tax=Microbulbifer marinus TaxID=658218 RepID=A0A1H3W0B3_9GAMM|nr:monovalent cation/H(+) antiporter subunit G [Microbulbifer marinus]SDZ80497.1 multisubunit sodium/proton antiporter, MrpG subunit [Microbulbifer marinus]